VFIYNYALSDTEITRLTNNLPPPPNVPTTLTAFAGSNTLNFSWPTNYRGCRLLMQTNNLANGVSTNLNDWSAVDNSQQTNQVVLPIYPTLPMDFFRLVYP